MASLFVIQGRDQGRRFELPAGVFTIGRDVDNEIQLHDSEVSRKHVELSYGDGGFVAKDLGSSNGTIINDKTVTTHRLSNGDRVLLGRTLLIFTGVDESASDELEYNVDIVRQEDKSDRSRIVHSFRENEPTPHKQFDDELETAWLARARSNLQIMYRTALAVSHTLDIEQLLQRILELIFEWVEADRGCIMLLDQELQELLPKASRQRGRRRDDIERMEISRTILDYVMSSREGVVTSDAKEDERWDPAASIVRAGVREAICVPMQGRYGIVGVIYIDTYTPAGRSLQQTANRFSEDHLKLMIAIGHQAALAVEDTSYYSAMVQAERLAAMGQTIATLSHHIKNILQGIRGGSYLIEEGLKNEQSEIVRKGWKIVEKNQEKISHLVLDMLTFSKDREPDFQSADMNALVSDIVELLQARAAEAGVCLEARPCPNLTELPFDADLMHRAILNVAANAIDACESRPDAKVTITVQCTSAPSQLQVIVEDNGEGIADEDLQKIFTVFESRKGARGTGLGLPVSKKILREHGGDVTVSSRIGVGSRFVLELPVTATTIVQSPSETMTGKRP